MTGFRTALIGVVGVLAVLGTAETARAAKDSPAVARAQVWVPTDIAAMNLKAGPADPKGFPFLAEVECDYLDKKLSGKSPKFACNLGKDDELKVKYGGTNGEVYGEVVASRLLWALGFGADHMYPVRVVCRGCPAELGGIARADGAYLFDPAVIERKMPAAELAPGWAWGQLGAIDEAAGGAPRMHRDALKLLAVFIQHTDTKAQQQRVVCLDGEDIPIDAPCSQPLMMVQDVGVTFGRANTFNNNSSGSTNFARWSTTPIWKSERGCVGNLPKSFTGTLDDPVISEEGRQFLANLLEQLSDTQIRDLFDVSRVTLRLRAPGEARSGFPTVDEWVAAFTQKRDEIVTRRCG